MWQYAADEYLVEGVLDTETLTALRRVTDGFVAGAGDTTGHTPVLDLDPARTPGEPRVRRINCPPNGPGCLRRARCRMADRRNTASPDV